MFYTHICTGHIWISSSTWNVYTLIHDQSWFSIINIWNYWRSSSAYSCWHKKETKIILPLTRFLTYILSFENITMYTQENAFLNQLVILVASTVLCFLFPPSFAWCSCELACWWGRESPWEKCLRCMLQLKAVGHTIRLPGYLRFVYLWSQSSALWHLGFWFV